VQYPVWLAAAIGVLMTRRQVRDQGAAGNQAVRAEVTR